MRGYNTLGPGEYSDPSTSIALIVTKPHALTAIPIRNFPSSTKTKIAIDMPAISNGLTSGGLPITSYSLQWNGGGAGTNWSSLVGDPTDSTNTAFAKTGLATGTMYKFRYRVRNSVGWSDPSASMTTYAGTEPQQPAIPVTIIDPSSATKVKITWTAPGDNGGLSVSSY